MAKTSDLVAALAQIVGNDGVLHGPAAERVYSSDAYTVERSAPAVVVLPSNTEQVSLVVDYCRHAGLPFTPRGAGTGLSGGAMPALGGVVIATKRLNKVLAYSPKDRWILAQAGVVNAHVSRFAAPDHLHFAPDPSSQSVSTLGGNVAMNSGGPHTLKYGVTTQHILGVRMVLSSGEVVEIGGPHGQEPGLDLLSLVIGSEGILGIVTEIWASLTPDPERIFTAAAYFGSVQDASLAVAAIIRSGSRPAALEMMDANVLKAVARAYPIHQPPDTAAMLLIETDGLASTAESDLEKIEELCQRSNAIEFVRASSESERNLLWTARKKGVGSLGRLAPTVVTHDGVIPPSRLPLMLERVYEIAERHKIGVANIFHAGDGNLHPIFYFDQRLPGKIDAVIAAGREVIESCLEFGGSVTGEHGIGVEKTDLLAAMLSPESLAFQSKIPAAFGSGELCNPCKVIPSGKGCMEHRTRWRGAAT